MFARTPAYRHALVPSGFRRQVRRLTRKHSSRLPLSETGIQLAVLHGAPLRIIWLKPRPPGTRSARGGGCTVKPAKFLEPLGSGFAPRISPLGRPFQPTFPK